MTKLKVHLPIALMSISLLQITMCEAQSKKEDVIINNKILSAEDIEQFKSTYKVAPLAGEYWYDSKSGIFGNIGGPAIGILYSGHQLGNLSADVSNGTSGVFVNGRQLQKSEAVTLAKLFGYHSYVPARYWLQANGNIGLEGYPIALGNVYAAISQSSRTRTSGSNLWSKGLYSGGNYYTGSGGQPSVGYVSVPGYGPISHGMD